MPVKLEIVEMAGAIMRRLAALIFLVSFCGSALAQVADDPELRRLTALLDAIRQEQQSVYKQFQMIESLQRSELKSAESGPPVDFQDGKAPNYDDAVRAKEDRQARIKSYSEEMNDLSARYRDLGNQATVLVEEIRGLANATR